MTGVQTCALPISSWANVVHQEKECEQKALECERLAANLPDQGELFSRIHLDLAESGARRRLALPPLSDGETSLLLNYRRRIAGEDAPRGGLMFVCRKPKPLLPRQPLKARRDQHPFNDPADWRSREEKSGRLLKDPDTTWMMLDGAADYDVLADRAKQGW